MNRIHPSSQTMAREPERPREEAERDLEYFMAKALLGVYMMKSEQFRKESSASSSLG